MAQLWFIRHFRTPWNSAGRLQGQREVALDDPLDRADLAALDRNRTALSGQSFALVLTSPLGRARQTAALHGYPTAEPDDDLLELSFGLWEGRSFADLNAAHPGLWFTDAARLPLGESFPDFTRRVGRVRQRVLDAGGPVLAFGHGAWLGGLRQHLTGSKGFPDRGIHNGELVVFDLATAAELGPVG